MGWLLLGSALANLALLFVIIRLGWTLVEIAKANTQTAGMLDEVITKLKDWELRR